MKEINIQYFDTNIGELILGAYGNKLILCDWRHRKTRQQIDNRLQKNLACRYIEKDSHILQQSRLQLMQYFSNKRHRFNIPLKLIGTDFQKLIWTRLCKIPCGNTTCYQDIANQIAKGQAVRAVANAIAANSLSIFIPCHRVISKNGSLGGYAGGSNAKSKLLALENISQ